MICFECDEQLPKGANKCPNCGIEYGDVASALAAINKKQEEQTVAAETPKKGRGRPRKTDVTVTSTTSPTTATVVKAKPASSSKPSINNTDKVFPWDRYDSRYPSVIAPARIQGSSFCPTSPKKDGDGYSTKEEDVLAWVEEVVLIGHQVRKLNYTLTAILYFAAKFWEEFPSGGQINMENESEYAKVKKILLGVFL